MKSNGEIKTTDFYQSAILKTLGLELLRLEKVNEKQFLFVFNDSKNEVEEILNKYWRREITLNARDLIDNIRDLKTRMYQKI